MAESEADRISHAIKLTQKLRASVTKVFTNLSDGFHASPSEEKVLLAQLQKSLLAVNDNFRSGEIIEFLDDNARICTPLAANIYGTGNGS
ncbi:hypothetical protein FSP39_000442 [Pinctada imbricata]|uniref:Uncharacterized protein n=1 Tax=Pinctada imbricata TaxID=66713 RepID=A0AA88Y2K8_PINIB|nr:hypothetical protein FSP39_000442 [Pinctada imbricata]